MPSPTSRDVSTSPEAFDPAPLRAHWLAELIRLREAHWGPLEDAAVVRRVRQLDIPLPARILARAQALAQRENLVPLVDGWRRSAFAVLALLLLLALLSGAGVAAGALGDGGRAVNVLWALAALLGLHLLTFVLWLASFLLRPAAMTPLGRLWLWATRKLARGPDSALVPQAFLNLLARAGALRGLFGAVSHGLWLAGLGAALATLLALLSTASYRFIWATTLLAPDTFVWLTQVVGWLPSQLGFPLPDAAMVRASDGVQALGADAQVQWSWWLIGVFVTYGIVPRLLAWLACLLVTRRALRGLAIDPALAGYAALRDRLEPPAQSTGIDRPVDPLHQPRVAAPLPAALGGQPVLMGLELPADLHWPPPRPDRVHPPGGQPGHARAAQPPAGCLVAGRRLAPADRLRCAPDARPRHAGLDRRAGGARRPDPRLAAGAGRGRHPRSAVARTPGRPGAGGRRRLRARRRGAGLAGAGP